MPRLKELIIANNNLSQIDSSLCKKASNLESLDLSHNNLVWKSLFNIDLIVDNGYYDWDELSVNCKNISKLNLSFNNITKFLYWKRKMVSLYKRHLYLDYNHIEEIDVSKVTKKLLKVLKFFKMYDKYFSYIK